MRFFMDVPEIDQVQDPTNFKLYQRRLEGWPSDTVFLSRSDFAHCVADQSDHKQGQTDPENNFCDSGSCSGDSSESKNSGDQGNDEEN